VPITAPRGCGKRTPALALNRLIPRARGARVRGTRTA
jgi:energy-coupling factor transporter ATP-binding protein EcfA2